jgi:hypothetical protein
VPTVWRSECLTSWNPQGLTTRSVQELLFAFNVLILTSLQGRGRKNNSKHTSMCCLISQFTLHASGCRTFPTTKKSCYVGLEKQTVPYLLSKQCLHPRSKKYPTYSVNCTCTYGANSTRTYLANNACTYGAKSTRIHSAIRRF